MGVFSTIVKRLGPIEKPIQFPFEWEFWPLDCAQQIGTLVRSNSEMVFSPF